MLFLRPSINWIKSYQNKDLYKNPYKDNSIMEKSSLDHEKILLEISQKIDIDLS